MKAGNMSCCFAAWLQAL